MLTERILMELLKGSVDTLYMTLASSFFAYVLGLPMGVILIITAKNGLRPLPIVNKVLGFVINIIRSAPFLILVIALLGFIRIIVGKSYGPTAMVVGLVIAAAPFVARMVESSLLEVDKGVIEAAQSMGASTFQIIHKVMLPESLPSLLNGATISVTTIFSYSAMAGFLGSGGLGAIAINYGFYRFNMPIMLWALLFMIIIVQVLQAIGTVLTKVIDKRLN